MKCHVLVLTVCVLLAACARSEQPATPSASGAVPGWTAETEAQLRTSCAQNPDCACFAQEIERRIAPSEYFRQPPSQEVIDQERQVEAVCRARATTPASTPRGP